MSNAIAESHKRRYVGTKESMSYILFDSSKTFNINKHKTFFIFNVLRLNPVVNTFIELIKGWWDVLNDGFLGVLIDKTSTRWGKFKPYYLSYIVFGSALMMLYWTAPFLFIGQLREPGAVLGGFKPLFLWLLIATSYDLFETVRDLSAGGLLAGISPNPDDRVRLCSRAELISSIWENIPEWIMSIAIDRLSKLGVAAEVKDGMFRSLFASMGVVTVAASVILAVVFLLRSRERISQTLERPQFLEGFKIVLRSRPIALAVSAELFTSISSSDISAQLEKFYFLDVLGSLFLRDVIMIPGGFISMVSYTYLQKFRQMFSVKALWLFGMHIKEFFSLIILLTGSFGSLYKRRAAMLPLLFIQDIVTKSVLSFAKIIPREITMDAIDYVEWTNGFRAEGLILSAKGILPKALKNTLGSFVTLLMNRVGYRQGTGVVQTEKVKRSLFRIAFGVPTVISAMGMLPKFFYDLTGEKRERMYAELSEVRRRRQDEITQING